MPDLVKKRIKLTKDPSGAPANDVSQLSDEHKDLKNMANKVGISLSKRDLSGIRGQVVVILDHSYSMLDDYQNGTVQALVQRALAFALQIDVDGEVPIIPFDEQLYPTVIATVDNYLDIVDREIWRPDLMSTTIMSSPLERLKEIAEASDEPIIAIFVGDGSPNRDDKDATRRVAYELAGYPVWIKFLTLRPVGFLKELDNATEEDRLLDNIDAQDVPNPLGITPMDFADLMTEEYPEWIAAASAKGVLT